LRELRDMGCSAAMICAPQGNMIVVRPPGSAPVVSESAAILRRYLERHAELGLDGSSAAPLIVDLEVTRFLWSGCKPITRPPARCAWRWRPMVHFARSISRLLDGGGLPIPIAWPILGRTPEKGGKHAHPEE
jgi:hypothetical protein